jgi:dienelactone hydrolase
MNRALSLVSRLVACVATCTMSVTGCAGAPPVTAPASAQAAPSPARSAHPVRSEIVPYSEGATPLEGYLAIPADSAAGARLPALLVFHDWMGLGEGTKRRADQLAALGYVAFAADVYGAGVHPANAGEAGKLAGKFKEDRALLRARGAAALKALAASAHADPTRVVAMGYCFGGTAALELGRSGAAVAGIVTFHGGLATPHPEDARNIKGRVLALHGADDPFVKAEEVLAFEDEMRQAGVDWQLKAYGGAVHAFTVKEAGSDPKKGAAYDARADARSWAELQLFLGELFPR